MVSPPEKNGIPLESIGESGSDIQAAENGDAFAYDAEGSINSEAAGNRSFDYSQLLARRGTGGWSTQDIATPHQAPVGQQPGSLSEYRIFSPDLSLALVEPEGATPISPDATERTPYLRQSDGEYLPLLTEANVPSRGEVWRPGIRLRRV